MMKMSFSILFQLLALHNHQFILLTRLQTDYIMGNDILTTTKQSPYIPTKRLYLSGSTSKLQPEIIQNVFGKHSQVKLNKNHTVSYLIPNTEVEEAIEQENTFQQQDLNERTFSLMKPQTSTNTNQAVSIINHLYEEIERLRHRISQQKYNSKNYSPVKKERQNKEINDFNKSFTRNRKHYFRLKGCYNKDHSLQNKTKS